MNAEHPTPNIPDEHTHTDVWKECIVTGPHGHRLKIETHTITRASRYVGRNPRDPGRPGAETDPCE